MKFDEWLLFEGINELPLPDKDIRQLRRGDYEITSDGETYMFFARELWRDGKKYLEFSFGRKDENDEVVTKKLGSHKNKLLLFSKLYTCFMDVVRKHNPERMFAQTDNPKLLDLYSKMVSQFWHTNIGIKYDFKVDDPSKPGKKYIILSRVEKINEWSQPM